MKVFTQSYRPFSFGGVDAPMASDVPVLGPYDLGKEFQGYCFITPAGKTYVVEAESGGIVGPNLEQVRKDIEDCDDIVMMRKQVSDAKEQAKKAFIVTPEEFYAKLDKTNGESSL